MAGHRGAHTYISKDPQKRSNSLANLLRGRGQTKKLKKTKAFIVKFDYMGYRHDIISFVENNIVLTETGKLVRLEEWQKELFYRPIFNSDPHIETALITIPKKNSKSWLAMTALLWAWSTHPDHEAEYYVVSNDMLQSQSIIFKKCIAAITRNPYLHVMAEISGTEIKNKITGATIIPVARDYRGSAGLSPKYVVFDEMSLMDLPEQERLVEELQIAPVYEGKSLILVVSTHGYRQEGMFWDLYQRALANIPGSEDYDDSFYSLIVQNENPASFVTDTYLARQKRKLKPAQFNRMHLNLPQEGEGSLISEEIYKKNVNPLLIPRPNREAPIFIGIDASLRHDSTACCAIERHEGNRFTLIDHQVITPHSGQTLDLEKVVEEWVTGLSEKYIIEGAGYDPWQMAVVSKHLTDKGINMVEVAQNVKIMGQGVNALFSCLREGNLQMYPDPVIREHLLNAVIEERKDGTYRLMKSQSRLHIDFAVCLAVALYVAMQEESDEGGEFEVFAGNGWKSAYGG